jgi:type IV secretion system protein VirD4
MTSRWSLPSLFFGGLALVLALTTATAIGWWELNGAAGLGEPWYRSRIITLYAPWEAARWWWLWGHDQAFMVRFWDGAENALYFSALFTLFCLHMVRSFGPLPHVEEEEQPHRWGTVADLLESPRISVTKPGIVLGLHGQDPVWHVGDDHVLLVGASRVGEKGVSFVLPSIVDCPDSMIVFDPKGELYGATADERERLGPVWLFDPTRPGTHRFNPLDEMRLDERNINDCKALGLMMSSGMEGKDPFWALSAGKLGAAIARVVCTDGGPRTLERMHEIAWGIRMGTAPPTRDEWARRIILSHLSLPNDRGVRPGVDSQLELALWSASDPMGAAATAASDFTVADLCAEGSAATVYITLPTSQVDALKGIARLALQALLLGVMHDVATVKDGRRKTRRVVWLVDEFPLLGHLPFLERALGAAAGHGVKMFLVAQDMNDIEQSYGNNQRILGNCGTFVWVPSFSRDTVAHATAIAGTMIAHMRARHRKVGVLDRPSETASQSRHPVINPREALRMGRDHALVMHHGTDPVWLPKCRWYEQPRYCGRIKDVHLKFGD